MGWRGVRPSAQRGEGGARVERWSASRGQHRCEVASIAVEEEDVDEAKAGDNVRLKLKNCEEEVRRPGAPA